ncbi:MBL fold metallo-hydrolase [Kitasatospora kifunensis]|uniref:Glyoxylase-like metal-dependent hydrolase (Beta-lactamase superfamily II) n=1 Tax=Kitasatospora kifunensis TaxID=58351 RepID=A0A7W7QWV0_KITKI|nr:MBL fold metallo-hydrolase [Kitasatospora kifunensis]MBB4921217.1 glyoxylase-like metal-dependent hydrolase (beta-lactamase superfamily II) [Kitasatospora kifunensis]
MMINQDVLPIADGVYARLTTPGAGWGLSNGGLIVSSSGPAAWVDAPYDRRLGEAFLAASTPLLAPGAGIDTVIVTHGNGDHLWGASVLPSAEIITTEETLHHIEYDPDPAELRAIVHSGASDPTTRYLLRHFGGFDWSDCVPVAPTRTFRGELDLRVGEIPVHLRAVGPAHTGGDLIVHLPEQRVVFAGDVIFASTDEQPGDHPVHWAGPISGIIQACQDILDTGALTIVPGHGPLLDRDGVRAHLTYLEYLAERAQALHGAGLTAYEAAQRLAAERRYPELGLTERLVVTLSSEYRHLDGETQAPDPLQIVTQMARLAWELEAQG